MHDNGFVAAFLNSLENRANRNSFFALKCNGDSMRLDIDQHPIAKHCFVESLEPDQALLRPLGAEASDNPMDLDHHLVRIYQDLDCLFFSMGLT